MSNSQKLTADREFVTWSKNKNGSIVAREFFEEPGAAAAAQRAKEEHYRANDGDEDNGEPELETSHFSPCFIFREHLPYQRYTCDCKRCGQFIKLKNRAHSGVVGLDYIILKDSSYQDYGKYRASQEKILKETQKKLITLLRKVINYSAPKRIGNDIKGEIEKEIANFKKKMVQSTEKKGFLKKA